MTEVTQPTTPPSRYELREQLHEAVVKELLGPALGSEEEVFDSRVSDRYMVGKLAPKNTLMDVTADDHTPEDAYVSTQDGAGEKSNSLNESLTPSSFGMSFRVGMDADAMQVHAAWGHYTRTESETRLTDAGNAAQVWKREAAGGILVIPLKPGKFGPVIPDSRQPNVFIQGVIRPPTTTDEKIISIFIVNGQKKPEKNQDEAWLFQPEIVVTASDGAPIFRQRLSHNSDADDPEKTALAMMYRNQVEFAIGHGVSVHAEADIEAPNRAVMIKTSVIPYYDVPITEAPTIEDIPGFGNLALDMMKLAEMDKDSLKDNLSILLVEYKKWIDTQKERIDKGELSNYAQAGIAAMERCENSLNKIKDGINKVATDDDAFEAFRFANRAMWKQRVHGINSLKIRRGEETTIEEIDIPLNRSWRPFQLAFFLITIPSLTDPTHPDRVEPISAAADLLWFPTGGGKTEAYLGVAAYTMAIRRLQGEVGGLDGMNGLAVIMRYTLRLLTLQQFQRATTLLCAMEVLRREAIENGDTKWGEKPFRIGLWVGDKATPNKTKTAAEAIRNAMGDTWRYTGSGTPAQLTSCPWCGKEIVPGRDIKVHLPEQGVGRTLIFCSDMYGRCPFSKAKSPGEGLPVVVVDEEIYRLIPAMLIATVDKFAQMPWKGEVQTLFGRVKGYCPRHGFLSPDSECGDHRERGNLPATKREEHGRLRPPDLIIQDELHLISGPLGTLVGLYETAVDALSTWELEGHKIRPKVIASTATVRKAKEQVHGIFLRKVDIFPAHGLDASDNFFSKQREVSPEKPGRRYMGICAPGVSRSAVLIRIYTAFLTAGQFLREELGINGSMADPWMTLVGYFNSLRELGGTRRLAEDDILTRSLQINSGELERPGLRRRGPREIKELTSRATSSDIPKILDQLEVGFPAAKEKPTGKPIDVILSTNMISVGVDVQRLGLMVVSGQPKTTAEYIQATSRVGRAAPGLVCAALNWARPRDLSHYEGFEHYHATFYKHVEALSVTPFAPRAVDRGLSGVLASLVRLSALDYNENKSAGELTDTKDKLVVDSISEITNRAWGVTGERIKELVMDMLKQRVDKWASEAQQGGRILGYKSEKDGKTVGLLKKPGPNLWETFTTPNSMREVEPGVNLILKTKIGRDTVDWSARTSSGNARENS